MQYTRLLPRFLLLALSLLSACAAADPSSRVAGSGAAAAPAAPGHDVSGAPGNFLTGRFAALQNDLGFASDQFLAALAADPDNVELQQQAFLTTLLAGRPEAVQLAEKQTNSQAAVMLLGDTDASAGRWDRAEARFASLPKQGLTQILQPLLVAWAQFGAGKTDAAMATLQPFVDAPRFRAVYAMHEALIADIAGRKADAARLYQIAQTQYGGTSLQLARTVASWQTRQGNATDAQATLQTLADASPDVAIALPALRSAIAAPQVRNATDGMAESYLALAAALRAQDANDFAVVLLQLALDLRPDFTVARMLYGEILDSRGHPDAALQLLSAVSASDPLLAMVRVRIAALTDRNGDSAAALHQLDQLAADFPDRPEAPAMQGDILRVQRRYTEAVAAYDKAVALVPHPAAANWPLFYDRGMALDRARQWPRAEADFLKALELTPDQPYVLNYLGYSWAEQGRNLPRARQMIERAVELRPNDGAIVDSLGWVVFRQGDIHGAVRYLERAVELDPEDASVNGHLGDAYWSAGRKLEAQYQWRLSLNLNPEPEDIAKLQQKLREGDQASRAAAPATAGPAGPAAPAQTVQ